METLSALLVATPVFGFALVPPAATSIAPAEPLAVAAMAADGDEGGGALSDEEYAAALRERADLTKLHRPLGIATWVSMGVTLLLGGFQYHDRYGTFGGAEDAPCTTGEGIILDQCIKPRWVHGVAAGITTALYAATFTISLMMPDPDNSDEGDGEFASTLRMHKLLRWVHLGGMVLQSVLGLMIGNANILGLERASDFGTLQAIATVHLGIGILTYGALTWAGILML